MFENFSNVIFSCSYSKAKDLPNNSKYKTMQDLQKDCIKISHFLDSLHQHKIAVLCEDTYDFIASLFACFIAKKEPYLLHSKNHLKADMFLLSEVSNILKSNPNKQPITQSKPIALIPHKARFFIQTSGSSGEPKFIQKNLYQMLCEAKFLAQFFKPSSIASEVVFVGAIPHRHLFGLTFKVFLPLVCGGVVLTEQILSHHLLVEVLNTHKNTILLASPTALEIMLKDEINEIAPPSAIFCAGSKLKQNIKASLQKRFGKHLQQFVEIYGSSETGVIGYNDNIAQKEGDFCAFPPVKLGLDSNLRLIISSPWLDSFEGEGAEFISQDCAKIDNNGLNTTFTLLGRHDRIIKLNETRINLDFVESTLISHNFIENARVGKLDGQNRLSAIITLSSDGKKHFRAQGKKGIKSALKPLLDSLSLTSALRYFHIRSKLPYNQAGKITLKDFEECIKAKITPNFKPILESNVKSNAESSALVDLRLKDSCTLQAYIDEGCFYFSGHFADFPLVPGFVELDFAITNASKYLGVQLESISHIQSVKFSHFLRPCDMCRLELIRDKNRLNFTIYANDKICASGKVALQESR